MEPHRHHREAKGATARSLADRRVTTHLAATGAASVLPVVRLVHTVGFQEEEACRHQRSQTKHRTGSPGQVPGCGTLYLWWRESFERLHGELALRWVLRLPSLDC